MIDRVEFDEETETDAIEAQKRQRNTPRGVFQRESASRKNRITLVFALLAFFFCTYIFITVFLHQYKVHRIIPYSQQPEEIKNKFPLPVQKFYADKQKYTL